MFIMGPCGSITLDLKVQMQWIKHVAACFSLWLRSDFLAADSEAEIRVQEAYQAVLLGSAPAGDQRKQEWAERVAGLTGSHTRP